MHSVWCVYERAPLFSAMSLCVSCHRLLYMIYRRKQQQRLTLMHMFIPLVSLCVSIPLLARSLSSPQQSFSIVARLNRLCFVYCGIDRRNGSFITAHSHRSRHSTLIQRTDSFSLLLSGQTNTSNEINKTTIFFRSLSRFYSSSQTELLSDTTHIYRDNQSEGTIFLIVYLQTLLQLVVVPECVCVWACIFLLLCVCEFELNR